MSENKKHVHAELMMQYAQDAFKTYEPWKLWEQLCTDGEWRGLSSNPEWIIYSLYRRKSEMINIGKVSFPKPVDYELKIGEIYYVTFMSYMMRWSNCDEDYSYLKDKRVHLTVEATKQHEDALIKISRGEF
ncbi:hypothetical protein GPY51_22545 [Photorhabdus laumondii subsp. laumondii]|uniref:Uncharacterized protein n=1 Tax=Photorhabdus laumondii subsp. laumondii TaxID=141679 RepID=A0A6L9JUX9_PHOLM|nr:MULTISPECIES: hypothetical protein [Photorhabdus]MCC8386163.1 hypothetical protein [Photorhabdus laumondii]MCC8388841.1 hypothetical protein [Photorhabdus laumondii]MCC8415310.1 hypothetical protein [Photorhabdus laumondii]MCZ1250608.1 hypothetical protein [Photorhabdus laumondii subsp. laumondii]NDK97137.1 hypothetical protein [Photorhabdus laumondii subsp. laumondii]